MPRLRHYELLLQLGSTSDYQVYLAKDEHARLLSICQARPTLDPAECHQLAATLLALKQRPHPHLPEVVDIATDDDTWFWVSDYVEGETLDALTAARQERPPLPIVLRVGLDVGSALQELVRLDHAGPVLPGDVLVGTDGVSRLIPPATWSSPRRRELQRLAASLPGVDTGALYLCAFMWEGITNVPMAACVNGSALSPLSQLAKDVPERIERSLSTAAGQTDTRFANLTEFVLALSKSGQEVASRAAVADWLKDLIRHRLLTRSRLLRSKYPSKPDGSVPSVRLCEKRDIRSLEHEPDTSATERPLPLPTVLTPQPFADDDQSDPDEDVLAKTPRSAVRMSMTPDPDATATAPSSSMPSSSVRNSGVGVFGAAKSDDTRFSDATKRAPLENVLAEYAERVGKDHR